MLFSWLAVRLPFAEASNRAGWRMASVAVRIVFQVILMSRLRPPKKDPPALLR